MDPPTGPELSPLGGISSSNSMILLLPEVLTTDNNPVVLPYVLYAIESNRHLEQAKLDTATSAHALRYSALKIKSSWFYEPGWKKRINLKEKDSRPNF